MHWVSKGQQWLVLGGTESVLGGTSDFLMILGQNRASVTLYIETKWRFGRVFPIPDSFTHSLTDFERYCHSAPKNEKWISRIANPDQMIMERCPR